MRASRRSILLVGVLTAGFAMVETTLGTVVAAQWAIVRQPGPASLDEALALVASCAALLLAGWLAVSTTAALLAHLPGRVGALADRLAAAWAPLVARRLAAALVGAALGGALAPGTAVADPSWRQLSPPAAAAAAASPAPPGPGWVPTRPVQRPQPSPRLVGAASAQPGAREVVVHRGDTLWGIAARHLGPQATDAEVATAWPRWHAANRAVIGADPGLLLPGQVLLAPDDRQGAPR